MITTQISYRQIMKATSLFGGVQLAQIIILVIRSKFIAVLLGPAGMGVAGLLQSATGLIAGFTNFGLKASAVKSIAAVCCTNDEKRIATVIIVLRRLVWLTGLLGLFITLGLAPWLSQITFGSREYSLAFAWLSITLLFDQLTAGQIAILQGMRKLNYLAKANLLGSVLGLIITIPLYYRFGIDGIVPGIIIASLIALLLAWYFSDKIVVQSLKVPRSETIAESKGMLTMGVLISLGGMITLGAAYIVRIFIGRYGGVDQVGLYNAGFAIINTYVGLIFTAMTTDYFPRLSAVAHSDELCKQTINQQAEVAILVLAPILIVFLVFLNWIIIILYSHNFISVNVMLHWASLGMFFKTACWSVGYIFLAKGTGRLFFWNELLGNLYILVLNLLGYYYFGLAGLGVSFLVGYFLYLIQVYLVAKIKYKFSYYHAFIKIFIIQIMLAIASFLAVKLLSNSFAYGIGLILIIVSVIFSLYELNLRLNFRNMLSNIYK